MIHFQLPSNENDKFCYKCAVVCVCLIHNLNLKCVYFKVVNDLYLDSHAL